MYLYHATGKENLESILKNGLITNPPKHNWEKMFTNNKIFLAFDADVAEDYIWSLEEPPEEVIVFRIPLDALDQQKINYDWNNRCEYTKDINSCTYEENIRPEDLEICNPREEEYQDIYDFEDTLLYERITRTFDEECETNKEYDDDLLY